MSRLPCPCGYTIHDTSWPPTHVATLFTKIEEHDLGLEFGRRDVIECPNCLGLLVEHPIGSGSYVRYLAEGEPIKMAESQGGYHG